MSINLNSIVCLFFRTAPSTTLDKNTQCHLNAHPFLLCSNTHNFKLTGTDHLRFPA